MLEENINFEDIDEICCSIESILDLDIEIMTALSISSPVD